MGVQPKRSRGRPAAPKADRRSENLTLRVRADLKEDLEHAAAETGRSLSAEAEARLGQDRLVDQVLDLAFGRQSAALLLLIGRLMRDVSMVADLASGRMPGATDGWVSEPFSFEQVKAAVNQALDTLRPEGEVVKPLDDQYHNLSDGVTNGILYAVAGHGVTGDLKSWGEKIRKRLGPEVLERIRARGYAPPGPSANTADFRLRGRIITPVGADRG